MRVKPTTFNEAVNVKASVLCPTCDCEKVDISVALRRTKGWAEDDRLIPVSLLSVLQTVISKAPRCYGNGDLVCGKCQCYDGWWGFNSSLSSRKWDFYLGYCFKPQSLFPSLVCPCLSFRLSTFCNCSTTASAQLTSQCIGPSEKEPCSGRGDCLECGTCVCYNPDQFEGPYCQYDKTQCQRYGGFLCNGTTVRHCWICGHLVFALCV